MEDNETKIRFSKNFTKSLIYTIGMFLFSIFGIGTVIGIIFNDVSGDWIEVNLFIGIIFTIFLCTFTIIDEIKKNTK